MNVFSGIGSILKKFKLTLLIILLALIPPFLVSALVLELNMVKLAEILVNNTSEIRQAEGWVKKLNLPDTSEYRLKMCMAPVEDFFNIDTLFIGKCRFLNAVSNGYLIIGKVKSGGYHLRGVMVAEDKVSIVEKTCPVSKPKCQWNKVLGIIEVKNNKITSVKLFNNFESDRDKEAISRLIFYLHGLYSFRRGEYPIKSSILCGVIFGIPRLIVLGILNGILS